MKFLLIYFDAVFGLISDSSFNWRYGILPTDHESGNYCNWNLET